MHNQSVDHISHSSRCEKNGHRNVGRRINMKTIAFFAILAATSIALAQEPAPEKSAVLLCAANPDGTFTYFRATPTQLRQTPQWGGRGEPPLSISEASLVATAFVQHKHPKLQKHTELHQIELSRIWHRNIKNRWFYHFAFNIQESVRDPKRQGTLRVAILFDGTIVYPTIEKE
jgi:hypothetical protein